MKDSTCIKSVKTKKGLIFSINNQYSFNEFKDIKMNSKVRVFTNDNDSVVMSKNVFSKYFNK